MFQVQKVKRACQVDKTARCGRRRGGRGCGHHRGAWLRGLDEGHIADFDDNVFGSVYIIRTNAAIRDTQDLHRRIYMSWVSEWKKSCGHAVQTAHVVQNMARLVLAWWAASYCCYVWWSPLLLCLFVDANSVCMHACELIMNA